LALGPVQPRLKPGVAIHVLRDCLAALAALHRDGVTHGDLKPSNIMLKRTGLAKVVDIGSAADLRSATGRRAWSPLYAAPEVLDGSPVTPQSDLASMGYVLVEMLAGRPPFEEAGWRELMEAKRTLEGRLAELMPIEVVGCELLVGLCRRLVTADPGNRSPDAGAADLGRGGGGRVPPATHAGEPGQRVRQRHPPVADGARPAARLRSPLTGDGCPADSSRASRHLGARAALAHSLPSAAPSSAMIWGSGHTRPARGLPASASMATWVAAEVRAAQPKTSRRRDTRSRRKGVAPGRSRPASARHAYSASVNRESLWPSGLRVTTKPNRPPPSSAASSRTGIRTR
jgi:serine/threonine protein kinase